jgi:hypothetical protein
MLYFSTNLIIFLHNLANLVPRISVSFLMPLIWAVELDFIMPLLLCLPFFYNIKSSFLTSVWFGL